MALHGVDKTCGVSEEERILPVNQSKLINLLSFNVSAKFTSDFFRQSGQDQKSVKFSHSVISLNQLLQNSKNTANIFLTFRNHVKIFLS